MELRDDPLDLARGRPYWPAEDGFRFAQPSYNRKSEVRLVRLGERRDVVAEEEDVVRLAGVFNQRGVFDAPPGLDRRPRHVEGTRVVDGDEHLQRLAAIDHLEALDDVHLFGVGRAIIVDERPIT